MGKCTSICWVLGVCVAMAAQAAADTPELSVERLAVPAAPNSAQGNIVADTKDRLWLSWIERDGDLALLKFARGRRDGRGFERPREIARGRDWFVNWADFPALRPLPNAGLAAFWLQKSADSTYAYDVRLSLSSDAGKRWSPAFSPHHDGTATEHGFVSLLPWDAGRLAAFWLDGRATTGAQGAGSMALRGAAIGSDRQLTEEWLLDARVCDCCQTDAALTNQGAIVVYRDRSPSEIRDIYALRWDGKRWSEPRAVHDDAWTMPACPVNGPAVVTQGDRVWVAWYTGASDPPVVRLARSLDGGASFEAPVTLGVDAALGRVDLAYSASLGLALSGLSEDSNGTRLWLATFDDRLQLRRQIEVDVLPRGRGTGVPRLAATARAYTLVWTESDNGRPTIAAARIAADESRP